MRFHERSSQSPQTRDSTTLAGITNPRINARQRPAVQITSRATCPAPASLLRHPPLEPNTLRAQQCRTARNGRAGAEKRTHGAGAKRVGAMTNWEWE